jgi:hypothetical protein
MFGKSPTAYRESFPPAVAWAMIPGCVTRVYGRPQYRTFREDGGSSGHIASSVQPDEHVNTATTAEEAP